MLSIYSVLVWLNNLICGGDGCGGDGCGGDGCGVLVRTVSPCAGCLLALSGVDVAPCANRMSAARLQSSCSHLIGKRVFGAASSKGSEEWMRFDVACPLVTQDRRCEPKSQTCELTSALPVPVP